MNITIQLDTLWVLIGAVLIFAMQAGFAMLESGFIRTKNTGNIAMKNLMDFACGSLAYLLIGYGLMYGVPSGGALGKLALFGTGISATDTLPKSAHIIFNIMFCGTAATIVSGAMAERTRFKCYLIYSVVISAVVYPIAASWVWGGGWLSTLHIGDAVGFVDFSGSTLVHMVGGISALVGAAMVGPRIGKYNKDGKPQGMPGHSITFAVLGIFLLWFGWFGFNSSSTYGLSTVEQAQKAADIMLSTNTSAAAGAVTAMIFTWIRYGKPEVTMILNGVLAGLVAITSGCAVIDPGWALIVGIFAGLIVVISIELFEKVLKIDDPVGAISVHGVVGCFGTLCTGLFSRENGLITRGDPSQLAIQCVGILAVGLWTGCTMLLLFGALKKTMGLRVSREMELMGLDAAEHGLRPDLSGYLTPSDYLMISEQDPEEDKKNVQPPEMAIPVHIDPAKREAMDKAELSKIVILTRQSKFEAVKDALNKIGVTGMTVTHVLGCGMQKGRLEYYRGAPVDTMQLLPKIQIDIVVAKIPPRTVIDAVKKVLYTGHIGDGKIFVYKVENAVKVRTGEEGYYAMQGVDE